jgi:hypothetical protein
MKLGHQFRAGSSGGKHIADTVGAGSLDFGKDGRKESGAWEKGAIGLREKGWRDVGAMMMEGSRAERAKQAAEKKKRALEHPETALGTQSQGEYLEPEKHEKPIFAGLTIYLNGSTAPMIGDHKLKHLIASHGGNISIALGRRTVTHVILGKHNDGKGDGAGGGLASSKIQKEISRVGGKGVKYVGVEWVIESVKAGRRLGEARFETLSTAPRGVRSVYGIFKGGAGSVDGDGGGRDAGSGDGNGNGNGNGNGIDGTGL